MKNEIFVVPNNDLEAKTIIDLLEKHHKKVLITNQTWGASWENLEKEIKEQLPLYDKVYGVELQGQAPKNGVNIDHHVYGEDDRSNSKSSLEQVAELLNVELSLKEKFISANDKGYIPAMEQLGKELKLSNDEIEKLVIEVRALDRQCQGITKEQEEEAVRAIEGLTKERFKEGNLIIVRMSHSKCATVTDRLHGLYHNLLIISGDGETNFYGNGSVIRALQEKFGGWSGGDITHDNGYWGSNTANQKEVEEFVRNFLKKGECVMGKRFTSLQGVMSRGGHIVNNYSTIYVKNGKWHEAIATQEMYGNEELEKVFMENGGVIVPHHEVDYEFFQLLPEKIQTTIKDIKKEYEELRKVAYMPSEVHYEYSIYLGTTDMLPKVSVRYY